MGELTASGTGVPPVSQANHGPNAKAARFGKLALGLCLGGLVLPALLAVLTALLKPPHAGAVWIGLIGITSISEIAALVLGIIGWRSAAGKAAVIVAALLPFLVIPVGIIVAHMTVRSSHEAKAVADRQRAISKHKVKSDSATLDPQWKALRDSWLRGQPRSADEMANDNAVLRFDLDWNVVVLRDGLQVVREVRLPDGYEWSFHRVTPRGTEDLGSLAELKIRHRQDQRNVCQEAYLLRGKLGDETGIHLRIESGGSGWGWGDSLAKLPAQGYAFWPYNGPNKDVVDQSMLVTAPTNMASLPGFGLVIERVFTGQIIGFDLDGGADVVPPPRLIAVQRIHAGIAANHRLHWPAARREDSLQAGESPARPATY